MKLIFAIGNPGADYTHTRHNIGFRLLDTLASRESAPWKEVARFKAYTAEYAAKAEKIILVKPTTFYNEVGQSLQAISAFYKLEPEHIVIIHDDLALPLGTLRARIGGSDAGNNGIKSVNQHGGERTSRVRIGIATDARAVINDTDFVLGRFTKKESEALAQFVIPTAIEFIESFIDSSFTPHSVNALPEQAAD